jgi:magnesium-transporting ATPase (P-type)
MSVIVRKQGEQQVTLFCKGADSMVAPCLHHGPENDIRGDVYEHIRVFAEQGLRNLAVARKHIPADAFAKWSTIHHEATTSGSDVRETKEREAMMLIEKDLVLIGATAIEDKLQDGVPQCIESLAEANIKLWVLTGDCQETAINIGKACSLLPSTMHVEVINAANVYTPESEHYRGELERMRDLITAAIKQEGVVRAGKHEYQKFGLVIDRGALKYAMGDELRELFLKLALNCDVCICCRVDPIQKGDVVELVREGAGKITLAIGDGANDVPMIQRAHLGVGISGQEGMQAVMASDYALAQLRCALQLRAALGAPPQAYCRGQVLA